MTAQPPKAVAVAGFGRCGTTTAMRILHALGWPPALGATQPDYEATSLNQLKNMTAEDVAGQAVKVLDQPLRTPLPTGIDWQVLLLTRDHTEQAESSIKFLTDMGLPARLDVRRMVAGMDRDLVLIRRALQYHTTHELDFTDIDNWPTHIANLIGQGATT